MRPLNRSHERRSPARAAWPALAIAVCAALSLTPSALAAECDVSYVAPGAGSWAEKTSWSGGSVPTSAQNVCIPAGHGPVEVPAGFEAEAHLVKAESKLVIAATGGLTVFASSTSEADHFAEIDVEGTLSTAGSKLIFSGATRVNGTVNRTSKLGSGTAKLASGTLEGKGTFDLSFLNEGGDVEPGGAGAIGTMSFPAGYADGEAGTLTLDIAGPGSIDLLEGGETSDQFFAGAVHVHVIPPFKPAVNETWTYGKSLGVLFEKVTVTPSAFKTLSEGSGLALLRLTEALPTEKEGENPHGEEPRKEEPKGGGGGGTQPEAGAEELALGCSRSQLVLNDVYIRGGRVQLLGSAARSLAGKTVKILFNEKKTVATATVAANGSFSTTAPLPPKRIREALTTRYSAAIGSVRSLHVKLTRRLQLEPPKASGTTVTLTGTVAPPLTKPVAPIVVEEQLQCGKTIVAARGKPAANGRFKIVLNLPAGTRAALFQLKSSVAANPHATRHGFTTYSLQLPVLVG